MLLVLSESSTLTVVLSKAFLIEDGLIDTFDGTLVARGQPELVAKQRQVKSNATGDAIARLGKLATKPFAKFTPQAIIRYFMYLPLNFIPVVGRSKSCEEYWAEPHRIRAATPNTSFCPSCAFETC